MNKVSLLMFFIDIGTHILWFIIDKSQRKF